MHLDYKHPLVCIIRRLFDRSVDVLENLNKYMEEYLDWERNMSMSFPWSSINHHQQETEQNIFFDPTRFDLPKPTSTICSSPVPAATGRQFTPATLDSINVASQSWCQTLTVVNGLHEGKTVIPLTIAAGTATNNNAYTSPPLHEDATSVIFSDSRKSRDEIIKKLSGASSDDSVTKEIDNVILSQSSSETNPNNGSGFYKENAPRSKRSRSDPVRSTISFRQATESDGFGSDQMKEMIYIAAAFRPVSFGDEEAVVERPRRKNVRISSDPQTVAARKRRERVSERIRVLQSLVPGGNRMDTASVLDEAANYLKFLRSQVKTLEQFGDYVSCGTATDAYSTNGEPLISHADSFFTIP